MQIKYKNTESPQEHIELHQCKGEGVDTQGQNVHSLDNSIVAFKQVSAGPLGAQSKLRLEILILREVGSSPMLPGLSDRAWEDL